MQEMMKRMIEGNIEFERGTLDFSCTKLELTISQGEVLEGNFTIRCVGNEYAVGYVRSSDIRMECLTEEFTGGECQIDYRFHGELLECGESVTGFFSVVSDQGEYELPFEVTVEDKVMYSSIGHIKNLSDFAALAKNSYDEAVRLFYSKDFERIFRKNEKQYYELFKGLSVYQGNPFNVEEFLVATGKKQKTTYHIEEAQLQADNPTDVTELSINILRNGWGCNRLTVKVQGDFIYTEKESITDDDFLGNRCTMSVFVDSRMLCAGKNYGKIIISDAENMLQVPVLIRVTGREKQLKSVNREKKKLLCKLVEQYQDFRLKKLPRETWFKESGKMVERLIHLDENEVSYRLFQAQLFITEERFHEAGWLLDHSANLIEKMRDVEGDILEAYYLYLTTLINEDEEYADRAADRVERLFKRNETKWQLAWLLLYMTGKYERGDAGKWQFLKRQYDYGCCSPIIYIEALNLLNQNPSLLRSLDSFELHVLYYGNKHVAITKDLLEQLCYLCGRRKEYSPLLLSILSNYYEICREESVLKEICSLLIKGNKAEPKYNMWYRRGVEAELRITKLYEYYMQTLDISRQQEIPKMVLMYFSYQNQLDYKHTAFLYRYLVENRNEYEELYVSNYQRMENFVLDQVRKGRIDDDLAFLYREFLKPEMISEQIADQMAELLFTCELRLKKEAFLQVIVRHPGDRTEKRYTLEGGRCLLPLYTDKDCILLEDSDGRRYASGDYYTVRQLTVPSRFMDPVDELIKDNLDWNLYYYEKRMGKILTSQHNVDRFLSMRLDPSLEQETCNDITMRLIKHYYENDMLQELDGLLEELDGDPFTAAERGQLLNFLIIRGQYDKAYRWLWGYDLYENDVKLLVKLISEMITQLEYRPDRRLLMITYMIFCKGKYDGVLLRYLCLYQSQISKEMCRIWKAAKNYDVERQELEERILVQLLFTGEEVTEKDTIFDAYRSGEGREELIHAYVIKSAYEYFVNDKILQADMLKGMQEIYRQEQETPDGTALELPRVCKLALLKYYAAFKAEITEDNKEMLRAFLQEMMRDGIHLKCFLEYKEFERELIPLADKTIVEYKGHTDSIIKIHYLLQRENGAAGTYMTEEMRPVCGGICFKDFVLFFGESLQYYITEERDGQEQMVENSVLQMSDIRDGSTECRFGQINEITISKVLQDYGTLDHLLATYYHRESYHKTLFHLQ